MEIVKTIADSMTEQVHVIMPAYINGAERLFGGQLLAWLDTVAGIVGRRHAEHNVVTACIDNLQFKESAYLNDTIVIIGRVTYVSNSSMEVRIDTYKEDTQGMRRPINRAYFVMVALDEKGQPVRVPRLEIETESQRAEWQGGQMRQQLRRERRQKGY